MNYASLSLAKHWQPAIEWSHNHSVQSELFRVIDVMRMAGNHHWLGTLLEELTAPETIDVLSEWQSGDESAAALCNLSRAVVRHPDIRHHYQPLSKGVSGRKHVLGSINDNYLFAVIAEHIYADTAPHRKWLAVLRCWLMVSALRLGRSGNVKDKLIRQVAKGIRLACDRDPAWYQVVIALESPATDLYELTAALDFRAYQLRQHGDERIKGEQNNFLRDLIALAQGKDGAESRPEAETLLATVLPAEVPAVPNFLRSIQDLRSEEDTGSTDEGIWIPDADAQGKVRLYQSNPQWSYQQQRLSSKSISLLNAEELHFLGWSWNKPNPFETDALIGWIDTLLVSEEPLRNLLGAFIWLAVHTGRSMSQVLRLEISDAVDLDWRLATDLTSVHRMPPQRAGGWTPKSAEQIAWVSPVSEANRLALPSTIRNVLRLIKPSAQPSTTLGSFWMLPQSPSTVFRDTLPDELSRLTPGMLRQVLPQSVFQRTQDGSFARLLGSNPASGLPGAVAYANWHQSQVDVVMSGSPGFPVPADPYLIGAGSRLDPLDELLINSIQQASSTFTQYQAAGDFLVVHNAYVAFLTVALFAATGVRPTRDPFESLAHFDFDARLVYVNDKTSGASRGGRLIPLPKVLLKQVDTYRRYLVGLIQRLRDHHPTLADAIATVTSIRVRGDMPFLLTNRAPLEPPNRGLMAPAKV